MGALGCTWSTVADKLLNFDGDLLEVARHDRDTCPDDLPIEDYLTRAALALLAIKLPSDTRKKGEMSA